MGSQGVDAARARRGSDAARDARPAFVMLHGLFGNVGNWDATQRHFEGRFRSIAVDFPILGGDGTHPSIPSLTDHVKRVLDEQRLRRIVIFGNSLGGQIALNFAIERPEQVLAADLANQSMGLDPACQ